MWINVTDGNETDNRDNDQMWAITAGWKIHACDPAYPFTNLADVPLIPPSTPPVYVPYRIGCGLETTVAANTGNTNYPSQVASSLVRAFEPDAYWNGTSTAGSTTHTISVSGVSNAAPANLYQTWRQGTTFGYTLFGLEPNTAATVYLHFCEPIYKRSGARTEKIVINGATVESGLDIYKTAGGANKALVRSYSVTPGADGLITITLTGLISGVPAILSGVEAGSTATGSGGNLPAGTYRLTPAIATGSALDDPGFVSTDGTQLDIWSWNGGDNQLYNVLDTGGGYYKLQFADDTTKCVDVYGGFSTNGTIVEAWDDNGGSNQRWKFVPVGNGNYYLVPGCAPDSCLEVHGGNPADGTLVDIWTNTASSYQQWQLQRQ
jgi:hypothetical protein